MASYMFNFILLRWHFVLYHYLVNESNKQEFDAYHYSDKAEAYKVYWIRY